MSKLADKSTANDKPPKGLTKAAEVYTRLNALPERAMDGIPSGLLREICESKHARPLAFQLLTDLVIDPKRPCTRRVNISYDELLRLLWKPAAEQRPQWKTDDEARLWLRENSPDAKDSNAVDQWWRDQRHLAVLHAVVRHVGDPSVFFAALFEFARAVAPHDAKAQRKLENQGGQLTRRELGIELTRRVGSAVRPGGAFTAFLWQVLAMRTELARVTEIFGDATTLVAGQAQQIATLTAEKVALVKQVDDQRQHITNLEAESQENALRLARESESRKLAVLHQDVAAQSAQFGLLTQLRRELLPRLQKVVEYTDRDIPNKDRILVLAREMEDELKKTDP